MSSYDDRKVMYNHSSRSSHSSYGVNGFSGEEGKSASTLWWIGMICIAIAILFAFTGILAIFYVVASIVFAIGWSKYHNADERDKRAKRFATLHCWSFIGTLVCSGCYIAFIFFVPGMVVSVMIIVIGIIVGIPNAGNAGNT